MSLVVDSTERSDAVYMLGGKDLGNGWKIGDLIIRGAAASGGCFSCGYVVENLAGERAYLKAFDFSHGLEDAPDPVETLHAMTSAFIFERELLKRCEQKHLKRVVTAIGAGQIKTLNAPGGAIYYLVFERADGDVRAMIDAESRFDMAWRLRTLHHIAAAVKQLHGVNIAHQDIKPSNVLFFRTEGSKVGDLGRAACPGLTPPHEDDAAPGDPDYAPPELLYGDYGDWKTRRLGCDLYHLGSMIVFFCTNLGITHLWLKHLDPSLRPPKNYFGKYDEVLPYVRNAFDSALTEFRAHVKPKPLADELCGMVSQLCDPDPRYRGHPLDRARNQFSVERYISRFDALARRAELGLLKD